jgi:uncharacterized protein YhjY with autotransporter beta-barrel domain
MSTKRVVVGLWRRFGLGCFALAGALVWPGFAQASPGCQYLNGQSGTISGGAYIGLLQNNQPVNQGDQITLTASGPVIYVGSFIRLTDSGGTVIGMESGSGPAADGIQNLTSSPVTYSIICTSAAPAVLNISPSAAAPGQTVTIAGSGFFGTSEVRFGSTPAVSFTIDITGDSITAIAPNGSGTVPISVTTDAGTFTGGSFTFQAPTVNAVNTSVAFDSSNNAIPLTVSGNPVSVAVASAASHGTTQVSGTSITYTPAVGYTGADSFTYTASNSAGTSAPATVSITVNPPPVPTVAAASATTSYNTATSINLASAISGVDITGVNIASNPSHGTVSVSGETVTYTPSSTFYGGTDTFTYTATNPGGASTPATITVTVGTVAVPTAANMSATTPYNTATDIHLASAISGTDITAITITSNPSHGTVSVSGETVTYTPSSIYYGGTDSFTYTATNPGGHSAPATVTITVTPLSTPTVTPLSVVTTKATPVLIDAAAEFHGTQPLTGVTVATQPAHGTATASGEQILYTPAAGFVGTDTFSYQLSNHFGASTPGTITVTVPAVGRATGSSVTVTTQPGSPVSVNLASVVPGSYVSSALLGLSPASAGNATLSQPSTLTFTPSATFHGLVQITAVLMASNGQSQTVDVLVLVNNQPNPSHNPDALGLVGAQTMQAERFAQNQLGNIQSRLDSLHDGNGTARFSNNLSVSLDGKPLQAVAGVDANGTQASNVSTSSFPGMRPGIGASESMDGAPAPTSDAPQGNTRASNTPAASGLGVWIDGSANFGAFDAYRQAAGFDSDNIAVNTGVDQRIGEHALIGISLGYNHDNSDIGNDGTRSVAQGYSAALYGSYQPAAHVYVDGVVGGGGLSFDSRRYASDSGTDLLGHRNGDQWFASLTAGYEYQACTWTMSPYGRFAWSMSSLNGYSETGDVTDALTYGAQTVRTSEAIAGIRASGKMPIGDALFLPHVRLEVGHDFQGTSDATLSYAFVPSAGSWNVLTNPYSANGTSVQAAFGGDWQLRNDWLITTEYQYLLMPHAHDQGIQIGLHKQF